MARAGYSGTPLAKKLGIKPGHRVALLKAPPEIRDHLADTAGDARFLDRLADTRDVILLFVKSRAELERRFPAAVRRLDPAGGLWVAWPKRASGVSTDVTEDTVREVALGAGLVDNKVCAIDPVWSGLRCVIRLKPARKPADPGGLGLAGPAAARKRPFPGTSGAWAL